MKQQIKNGIIFGLTASMVFTLFGVVYAAWNDTVGNGDTVSASSWNALVEKVEDMDNAVSFSGSTIQVEEICDETGANCQDISAGGSSGGSSGGGSSTWATFDATVDTNLTGSYSRAGTTVTVVAVDNGHVVGHYVHLNFTSGAASDGVYTVTSIIDSNTFTVTHAGSGSTSGSVTLSRKSLSGESNVHSVVPIANGLFYVNFTTVISSSNLASVGSCAVSIGNFGASAPSVVSTMAAFTNCYSSGNFRNHPINNFLVAGSSF